MAIEFSGSLSTVANVIAATGALGTAAYGLVDISKVCRGGVSNAGFGYLRRTLAPFHVAMKAIDKASPMETIRANWLNGVPKADQKAIAKSLIRLGLSPSNAGALAKAVGVDADALKSAATKIDKGSTLTSDDLNILGRFDVLVDTILDAGYERADQLYRNSAKFLAAVVATVLAIVAGWMLQTSPSFIDYIGSKQFLLSVLIGIIATPLAPIAKDLSSTLNAAVKAVSSVRN
jgi:hypothetical protein